MRNIIINFAASQYEKNGKYGIIKNAGLKITPQRKVVYEVMMELRHAAIENKIEAYHPTSTIPGGTCCVPSACLSMEKTIVYLKKLVIQVKINGSMTQFHHNLINHFTLRSDF